jgi:hypothetical protein
LIIVVYHVVMAVCNDQGGDADDRKRGAEPTVLHGTAGALSTYSYIGFALSAVLQPALRMVWLHTPAAAACFACLSVYCTDYVECYAVPYAMSLLTQSAHPALPSLQVPELGTPSNLGITIAAAQAQDAPALSATPSPADLLSSNSFSSSSSSSIASPAAAAALAAAPLQPQWTVERGSISSISPTATPTAAGPTEKLGYLRLSSFSSNAADDMHRAIAELEKSGVTGYILDLRDNPGGLVKSGIDIARLLLDGHPTLFAITGRDGEPLQEVGVLFLLLCSIIVSCRWCF